MRTLIVIPTYLEAENIADVLGKVRAAAPHADILVVDDASPDGTADLARCGRRRARPDRALVQPGQGRPGRRLPGRVRSTPSPTATRSSSRWTPTSRTRPTACPTLLAEVDKGADIAIGSRYVPGGPPPTGRLVRQVLSRVGQPLRLDAARRSG